MLGLRDRAMLEMLYATGLRVSELVNIKVAEVSLNEGVVRATGKGSKTRLVPLGEESLDWITRYLKEARPQILDGQVSDSMFRHPTRRRHDPSGILVSDQTPRQTGGDTKTSVTACAAPCLRHAFTQSWGRFASGADAAGTCGYLDHTDLYPCSAGKIEITTCDASSARLVIIRFLYALSPHPALSVRQYSGLGDFYFYPGRARIR